ncbi:hypothetical protein VTK56DRAFT_9300 [Thermocarpiscus australiensis]
MGLNLQMDHWGMNGTATHSSSLPPRLRVTANSDSIAHRTAKCVGGLVAAAMETPFQVRRDDPSEYTTPPFPSLYWPPQKSRIILYKLDDMWKFTLYWTLILYGLFHLGAAGVAVLMQVGKTRSHWTYLWLVPLVYALIAGFEAIIAGTLVGLIVGASYLAGGFTMSTWIPFVWGWVNVLVLLVSSFRIQGGL